MAAKTSLQKPKIWGVNLERKRGVNLLRKQGGQIGAEKGGQYQRIFQYETKQLEIFRREKETRLADLSQANKAIYQLFTKQFDERKSIIERDTSFSFLYLSEDIKYKAASLNYMDCLNNKCIIDNNNAKNNNLISNKESQLEKKFGETFSLWYPKLKNDKLVKEVNRSSECIKYFPELKEITFDENKWNDFEKFMGVYNSELKNAQIQNKIIINQYASELASTKSQLRSGVMNYFNERLSARKSQILTTQTQNKQFNSPTLGLIAYTIERTNFDKQAFQAVADDALEEQWKSNSLRTGEMPYSYCYGSSNYCGGYYCSQIKVKTGGADVLVTIKDRNRDVVRHAYINGGYSFTFNLPDGAYQVFFYSGSGWNPNKVMKSTSCGNLYGGFVSGENVTKDNYISINSQIMTYELILQRDGNLSTKPSSKDEAF